MTTTHMRGRRAAFPALVLAAAVLSPASSMAAVNPPRLFAAHVMSDARHFTFYNAPPASQTASEVPSLAFGNDGNLYYPGPLVQANAGVVPSIVQVQPKTGSVTSIPLHGAGLAKISANPTMAGLVVGADTRVWFGNTATCDIGATTTDGSAHIYPIVTQNPQTTRCELTVSAALGNDVWFGINYPARTYDNLIGYIDVTTHRYSLFPLPTGCCFVKFVYNIIAGPDGDIWFAYANGVGHLTSAGFVDVYNVYASSVLAGPDGNIWASSVYGLYIINTKGTLLKIITSPTEAFGQLSNGPNQLVWSAGTHGLTADAGLYQIEPKTYKITFTSFPAAEALTIQPLNLIAGPDGNLWFDTIGVGNATDSVGIGRLHL